MCPSFSPGTGTAQSLARIVTEAGEERRGLSVCAECSCPRDSGTELSSASLSHLGKDVFVLLLVMHNGLRGMITSFSENFSAFGAHGIICQ